eukprot:6168576-Pleurochrysis_carterae.AAC.1
MRRSCGRRARPLGASACLVQHRPRELLLHDAALGELLGALGELWRMLEHVGAHLLLPLVVRLRGQRPAQTPA